MSRITKTVSLLAMALASLMLVGCGNSEIATVEGTIHLDGEPLSGARVEFYPIGPDGNPSGRASYGQTDENGHYELNYTSEQKGARIGRHKVQITTFEDAGDYGGGQKERVPSRYNWDTELEVEVKPGHNVIDFLDLTSEGEIVKNPYGY